MNRFLFTRAILSGSISLCALLLLAGAMPQVDTWECDPYGYRPKKANPAGCEWEYDTGWYSQREVLLSSSDTAKSSAWEAVTNCGCGWYPHNVPCPTCQPDTISPAVTDTGTWNVTVAKAKQEGLSLKFNLMADVGYTASLTASEQQSLTGTHTETTTIVLVRQKILCFDRFYRTIWTERFRKKKRYADWTFRWLEWCNNNPATATTETSCSQLLAIGSFKWTTYPQFQWAPQKPPCGGVAISYPDPWDGKRETPCCADVCTPPPSPAHPCCGCEAIH